MQFGLWARSGSMNHEIDGVPIPPRGGAILGERIPIVKYKHFLPWAVQKRLNQSISRLGCWLGCAEGSTGSVVFARWRQCALPCGHIGTTWQIRLNRPSAVAMRSYVKLLWPLVIGAVITHPNEKGMNRIWCEENILTLYSPYMASLAGIPPGGLGLSGLVHKEAHPSISKSVCDH